MKNNPKPNSELNIKAKNLCNFNICCSMAHARRILQTLPKTKIDELIYKKLLEDYEIKYK